MLSQAVEMRRIRQRSPQSEVLGFEDQLRARGVEQDLAIGFSHDSKREGRLHEREDKVSIIYIASSRAWNNGLRNLIDFFCGIIDLDVQSLA